MRDRNMSGSILLSRIAAFIFVAPLLMLAFSAAAVAQGPVTAVVPAAPPPPAGPASKEVLDGWRNGMARVPAPNAGCFTSTYPNVQWQEVPCAQGQPMHPFPPVRGAKTVGPQPSSVGGGVDPVPGVTTGHISTAVGSFDSVSGVTSVTSYFGANDYSLQLNVNTFSSPVCSGAANPSQCVGWQQFIYSNGQCTSGPNQVPCTFMQYWLIGWGNTTCPSSVWTYYNNGGDDECYTNSNILVPPTQALSNLGNLSVTGQAISGGTDAVIFSSGSALYMVQNNDSLLGLSTGWTAAEYNLVGDCCGSGATINSGAAMVVRVSVDNGATTSAPVCVSGSFQGYTAETNSLYLQPASGTPRSSTQPAIVFTQNSNQTSTTPCSAGALVPAASKLVDTHDFNGNGVSDIAWRDGSGNGAIWLMSGGQVTASASIGNIATTWKIVGQRDFNGDGTYDLLWRDGSGNTAIWFMIGTQVLSSAGVGNVAATWSVAGVADFNGDGKGDLLWRDTSGNTAVWLMNGVAVLSSVGIGNVPVTTFSVAGTGDFNGDGKADILWRDSSGNASIWFMNGTQVSSAAPIGNISTDWTVVGTGDFNADGKTDIIWRSASTGNIAIWLMNGASVLSSAGIGSLTATWALGPTGDFNGDGKSDLLWRDGSGNTDIWFMNGVTVSSSASIGNIATTWMVQSVNAD